VWEGLPLIIGIMADTNHIPADRMHMVVTQCDALLNATEQQHLYECYECLSLFTGLVLSDDDNDSSEGRK
jgi:hypothetical protein